MRNKKTLYPYVLFARVKRLDLESEQGSVWERLEVAPAAASSCQSCSSSTGYILRVRLDTESPTASFYIFGEKLQMK